ncbi:hypothetical protein [Ancylomarina sp.]|uniref:hypothetical protein n=1 Tax=Ancylomarina sp. TaxID=1970196 RepID=UPI003568A0DA
MSALAFIIHMICWFLISKNGINKTESGKLFIDTIDTSFFNLLKWRASSAVVSDLKRLSHVFKVITILGFITTIILALFDVNPGFYFALTIIISTLIWVALMWGTNTRKEALDWIKKMGLILIAPWLFYAIDLINIDPALNILNIFKEQFFLPLGISLNNGIEIAAILTVILLIGLTAVTVYWFLQNSVIILLFVSILWVTIKISKVFLNIKESVIMNIAYILTPITMMIMFFYK